MDVKIFREIFTILENFSIVQYLRNSFDMKPSDGAEDESGQEMEQDRLWALSSFPPIQPLGGGGGITEQEKSEISIHTVCIKYKLFFMFVVANWEFCMQ